MQKVVLWIQICLEVYLVFLLTFPLGPRFLGGIHGDMSNDCINDSKWHNYCVNLTIFLKKAV